MTLDELQDRMRVFAEQRDWVQFHAPKNLALALGGEMGELMELLQWRSDDEIRAYAATAEGARALGDELADIAIYTARLADALSLRLDACLETNIVDNERRYPREEVMVDASKAPHIG